MKLDRSTNPERVGKYTLILNRKLSTECALTASQMVQASDALATLRKLGLLNEGLDPLDEFFVLKLQDVAAPIALRAYAQGIRLGAVLGDKDTIEYTEFAQEVEALAISAEQHPHRKLPD